MNQRSTAPSLMPTSARVALAAIAVMVVAAIPAEAQQKVDLRISAMATPGGLCAGNENKVRVNISNSQNVGFSGAIPVKLTVSQPPHPPSAYVATLNGIGPRTSAGQPVWFHGVVIPGTGSVTLHATVNPDLEVPETRYNNNDRLQRANVTKVCGEPAPPPAGANLTVTVYQAGTWQAGQGQWIQGANVNVSCGTGFNTSGQTGSNGKAVFASTPKSPPNCTIAVSKPGCTANSLTFKMPSYNTNRNVDLDCQ